MNIDNFENSKAAEINKGTCWAVACCSIHTYYSGKKINPDSIKTMLGIAKTDRGGKKTGWALGELGLKRVKLAIDKIGRDDFITKVDNEFKGNHPIVLTLQDTKSKIKHAVVLYSIEKNDVVKIKQFDYLGCTLGEIAFSGDSKIMTNLTSKQEWELTGMFATQAASTKVHEPSEA